MSKIKNINMRQFNGVDYDYLYPYTSISQVKDGLSKDEASGLYLPTTGGTMSGILDMDGNRISGVGTPTADNDAVNKSYVEDLVGGALNVFYGTYKGNDSNSLNITFEKEPKIVFISSQNDPGSTLSMLIGTAVLIREFPIVLALGQASSGQSAGGIIGVSCKTTWLGNTVTITDNSVYKWLNLSTTTYIYAALY